MAITQAVCSSFKQELMEAVHNFDSAAGDVFKIALYTSSATLDSTTTAYTTSNECPSTGNYTAGGNTLTTATGSVFLSGTTAYIDFDDTTWASSTISAAGALIYNSSQSNKAVLVLSFGGTYSSTNGNFTVQFPAATSSTAVLTLT
jgi:hypothetical protein